MIFILDYYVNALYVFTIWQMEFFRDQYDIRDRWKYVIGA